MPTDILTPDPWALAPRSHMAGDFDNPDGLTEEVCASCGDTVVTGAEKRTTRFSWRSSIPEEGVVGQEGTFSATGCHSENGGCFPATSADSEDGASGAGPPAGRDDLVPEREERGA